jgi:hypothetical protein
MERREKKASINKGPHPRQSERMRKKEGGEEREGEERTEIQRRGKNRFR